MCKQTWGCIRVLPAKFNTSATRCHPIHPYKNFNTQSLNTTMKGDIFH